MLADYSDGSEASTCRPLIHALSRTVKTLTMGEFCLDHEQQREASPRVRKRRLLPRLATGGALVAAAISGALIRARLPS